jgi:hypothetical protein
VAVDVVAVVEVLAAGVVALVVAAAVLEAAVTVVVTVVELPHPPTAAAIAIPPTATTSLRRGPTSAVFVLGAPHPARGMRPSAPMAPRAPLNPATYYHAGESLKATLEKHDPFWAPQLIVAGAIVLDLSLPDKLTLGPTWLLPGFEAALLLGLMIASPHPRVRHSPLRRRLALALISLVSLVNLISLFLLVHFLLHHGTKAETGRPLILAGIVLWVTNVLLFGLWYWELDRGGPITRVMTPEALPDFLFPQMTETRYAPPGWMPTLIDYLYVSFTNASAFSPTDTMPLTAIAKILMTTQAIAALVTIGLVVARAVNILT